MDISFNKRYLVIIILFFLFGTFYYIAFPNLVAKDLAVFCVYTILFTIALLIILAIVCWFFKTNKQIRKCSLFLFFAFLFFAIGILRTTFFIQTFNKASAQFSENAYIKGVVVSDLSLSSTEKSYSATLDVFEADGKPLKNTRIKLYFSKDKSIPKLFDIINCNLSLNLVNPPAFDGAFDYKEYLMQKDISAAFYTHNLSIDEKSPVNFLKSIAHKIRLKIINSVDSFPYSNDNAQLLKGILIGDISGFSDELFDKYSNSGFMHIASVSGMHTSYLLLFISTILMLIHFPKRYTAIIAIPILTIFAAVALFSASVLRAVIMASVLLLSSLFKRQNDSITSLFISAFIVVFINPYALLSTSFLLSYSATLGILIYYNLIKGQLSFMVFADKKYPFFQYLNEYVINSISLSLSSMLGLSYFSAKFFGKIHIGAIVGNIIMLPLVALVFFLGYLNCLLSLVCSEVALILSYYIINPFLSLLNGIASFFAKDFFHINVFSPSSLSFIIYFIILAAIYYILLPTKDTKA